MLLLLKNRGRLPDLRHDRYTGDLSFLGFRAFRVLSFFAGACSATLTTSSGFRPMSASINVLFQSPVRERAPRTAVKIRPLSVSIAPTKQCRALLVNPVLPPTKLLEYQRRESVFSISSRFPAVVVTVHSFLPTISLIRG